MGFWEGLIEIGSAFMFGVVDKALEISPDKIAEYNTKQLENLMKNGKGRTRDLAREELRKRK